MDTITHGLLGAVTAQLGFRHKIGRDATWLATLAAVTPDLDIFIGPILSLSGAETGEMGHAPYHRGLTHSLLMTPVIALVIGAAWWWFRRRTADQDVHPAGGDLVTHPEVARQVHLRPPERPTPFTLLYACVFVAALSHPLLDFCTSYGTQLLAPLTNTRYAWDALPIIDIIYTPLLILTLLLSFIVRKAGARRAATAIGWLGFLAAVAYIGAGRLLHDRAVRKAIDLAHQPKVIRADAYPSVGTIFLWRTVVETPTGWWVARIHQFGSSDPRSARTNFAPRVDNAWTRRAEELDVVKTFRWFCMGRMRATHTTRDGDHLVEFHDMRYARLAEDTEGLWLLRVTFDKSGNLLATERSHRHNRGDFAKLAAQAWADIWNP